MNQPVLLDTGPLVALLDRRDSHHAWVAGQMVQLPPIFRTCEAVIAEAFHLLRHLPAGRTAILEMILEGVLTVPFVLGDQSREILALLKRYANVPMSLADACLVRMSELYANSMVFTLDGDFRIYRRQKRRAIPVLMPPAM